ncbi:manganese-binding transcriptional regulator MntR [Brooklawnia cerclae]|uniref:Manganese transport regulator n=1 Tax=Brooklawnia cerclae TaxID=349934 RepID=A0ABX0SBZ9_9ACTN|nr:metal-dependent transcriptional regulator [Brooklawnia cerclae]NIH55454.1 DtxR family Mn-dependent transcriptional regulator [Brooklawnia cerclae]
MPVDDERPDGQLNRVAEDYLKAVWSASEWGGGPATVSSLAQRFATTKATVSANLKRLVSQGLVTHDPYRPIELTDAGEQVALTMVRRHRILETFLVELLGYEWDEVHDLAERLEHAATSEMIDRVDALLGHPEADPHGDPIPSSTGEVPYLAGARVMNTAEPGRYEILRISDAVADQLRSFADHQIRPGAVFSLEDARPGVRAIRLRDSGARLEVSDETLASVIARPADEG